jgi:predicted DNA-binding transcriptional regulator AlpA
MSRHELLKPVPSRVEQQARPTHRANQTVLRQMEICERLGISDESWRRWVRSGRAPQPLPNFPKLRPRWSVRAIEDFERGLGVQRYFGSARRHRPAV